jgi:hypothetical protein
VLIAERHRLAGTRVFRASWNPADVFVLQAFAGAEAAVAADYEDFMRRSGPGDSFLATARGAHSAVLMPVRSAGEYALYVKHPPPRVD